MQGAIAKEGICEILFVCLKYFRSQKAVSNPFLTITLWRGES